jgi:hypothetical protein
MFALLVAAMYSGFQTWRLITFTYVWRALMKTHRVHTESNPTGSASVERGACVDLAAIERDPEVRATFIAIQKSQRFTPSAAKKAFANVKSPSK